MIVKLVDSTSYELKEGEELTFGDVGVYIWNFGRDENGNQHYPPKRFYVYGFVREVINE